MATTVSVKPDTDVSGTIVYQSDIPYLTMGLWKEATQSNGETAYSNLLKSETFNYNFLLDPAANDGITSVVQGLDPNTVNTIYAVPTSGITGGKLVIAATNKLYVTDNGIRWAECLGDVPTTITNIKHNAGVWYVCGDASTGRNFALSYDGVMWGSVNTQTNPYMSIVNDIAFDAFGMGVAIGNYGSHNISLLLNNQVWMPVETTLFTANRPQVVINTTHWYIFAPNEMAESYNGITWASTLSTYVPVNPIAADWDKLNDTLAVLDNNTVHINVNGVWTTSFDVLNIGTPTDIKFNGRYWIVSGNGKPASFVSFTSQSLSPMTLSYGSETTISSLTWDGERWATLVPSGINYFDNPGITGSYPSGYVPQANTYIKVASNRDFPYGGPSSTDLDPAVQDIQQLANVIGNDSAVLTFVPVSKKLTGTVAYTKQSLNNFNLSFTTDIYSPKNIVLTSPTDTFTLQILESSNQEPLVFSTTTNQASNQIYDFINDGINYSRIYQFGSAFSSQVNTINEINNFVTNIPRSYNSPPWLDQRVNIQEAIDKFTSGETSYSMNELFDYSKDDFIAVENFANVANPVGVLNGPTVYSLENLASSIAQYDSSNFNVVLSKFNNAAGATSASIQSNYTDLKAYDPNVQDTFEHVMDLTKISGVTLLDARAKTECLNALKTIGTLEYATTTEYNEREFINPYYENNFPDINLMAGCTSNIQVHKNIVLDRINNYKIPVSPSSYTSKSVFNIKYDGNILSYKVDSKLIQQYYVTGPLNLNVNFNSFNSLFDSLTPMNYKPIISLSFSFDNSQIQLLKNLSQIVYAGISFPSKPTFITNLNHSAICGLIDGVEVGPPLPVGSNDYYYTISQFSSNPSLIQYCINSFNYTDIYSNSFVFDNDYKSQFTDLITKLDNSLSSQLVTVTTSPNTFTSPYPTKNYKFNYDYIAFLTAGVTLTYEYNVKDFEYFYGVFKQSVQYAGVTEVLSNYAKITTADDSYNLPKLPSRNIVNLIKNDLNYTVNTASVLKKLQNRLTISEDSVFRSSKIFNDTNNNQDVLAFLDSVKTLCTTLHDKSLFGKMFSIITDCLDFESVVDIILHQRLSNLELALNYLNNSETVLELPGDNAVLVDEIWDYFYNFKTATLNTPRGTFALDSLSYNTNLQYFSIATSITISGKTYPVPLGVYFPIAGVTFGESMPVSEYVKLSTFDPSYNSVILEFFSKNYLSDFPNSFYSAYNGWIPFTLLSKITEPEFVNKFITARIFSNQTLLSQIQYNTDRSYYIGLTLTDIASNVQSNIILTFDDIFLPSVQSLVSNAFSLDIRNTSYYVSNTQDSLFKKYLNVGDFATDYAGITSLGAYSPTDHYVDINRIYSAVALDYSTQNINTVKNLFDINGSSGLLGITTFINSIVDGTLPSLQSFNNKISKLKALSDIYNGTFKTDFNLWVQKTELYDNAIDSATRFTTMYSDIMSKEPPPVTTSKGEANDFIVSIPPYDTNRWIGLTGITGNQQYLYSRYNPYWKYYEGDIVGFNGELYQCTDTSRYRRVKGIPPGGYSQLTPSIDAVILPTTTLGAIGDGASGGVITYNFATGNTQISYYTYPTAYSLVHSGRSPLANIEPLLSWIEYHDIPVPVYSGNPPPKREKGDLFTDKEKEYTLFTDGQQINLSTELFDPLTPYYQGQQVYFNNTVYKCLGGVLINKDVGKGIPPGYSDSGSSWTLISGGQSDIIPGSNGVWTTHVEGITLNVSNILNPDSESVYAPNQTLPELNIYNPYLNALPYDPTVAYKIGDVVSYNGVLNVRLANAKVLNQSGTLVDVVNIAPASSLTIQSDSAWKAYPYMDLYADGQGIPAFDKNKSYNYGDMVIYKNVAYKYIVQIPNTYGPTFMPPSIQLYGTTITVQGETTSSFYTSGYVINGISLTQTDLSAGITSGQFTDLLGTSYDFLSGVTLIPGSTIYVGSTGAATYDTTKTYNTGDLIAYWGDFTYKSLISNNTQPPPPPNYTAKSGLFWEYVGSLSDPTIIVPLSTKPYSFTTDYNSLYHLKHVGNIYVTYDGGLWKWAFARGIDYSGLDPKMSDLAQYGVILGICPAQPFPFNPWKLTLVNGNINPYTNETIYQYNPNDSYDVDDIVFYNGFYFICGGNGFGNSIIDDVGTETPTQMYIPEQEVSYGRLLNSTSNSTYLETIITNFGVNWLDTSQPKWGHGVLFDSFSDYGFARETRYNFAYGIELTYAALKHDLAVIQGLSFSTPSMSSMVKSKYAFSFNSDALNNIGLPSPTVIDNNFKKCEFYYYSNIVKQINSFLGPSEAVNKIINTFYNNWKNFNGLIYQEGLQAYFSSKTMVPSLTGFPIMVKSLNFDPMYSLGFVYMGNNTVANIQIIKEQIDALQNGDIASFYFRRSNPDPNNLPSYAGATGLTLTTYSNGVRAFSTENMLDYRYLTNALGYLLPTAAFYDRTTGVRYYGEGATGQANLLAKSTLPYVPPNKDNYFYLDIETFENTKVGTQVPLTSFIAGWRDMSNAISELNEDLAKFQSIVYNLVQWPKMGAMIDKGFENNMNSLFREQLFLQTGYDEIIAVPIFTRKDREIFNLSVTNDWVTTPYVSPANNTFVNYKNTENYKNVSQPGITSSNYLTERVTFNGYPNIFLYADMSDAVTAINQLTPTQLSNDSQTVAQIRTVMASRLPGGLTGTTNFVNSKNYTLWQPWGQINDNADFSWSYDTRDTNSNNYANSGYVTSRSPSDIYRNTSYGKPSPKLINDTELFAKQGKHVITNDLWYTALTPYLMHFRMAGLLEQSCLKPESLAQDAKGLFIKKQQAIYSANYVKEIQAITIVAIAIISFAIGLAIEAVLSGLTIFTGGAGAVLQILVTAIITAAIELAIVAIIAAATNNSTNIVDLFQVCQDPGVMLAPPQKTIEGLAARCSAMESVATMLSDTSLASYSQSNPVAAYIEPPDYSAISFYEYAYALDYEKDLVLNLIPFAINSYDPTIPVVEADIAAYLQILGVAEESPEYNEYFANNGKTGAASLNNAAFYNAAYTYGTINNIKARYEQQFFFPQVYSYITKPRNAIIKVTDILSIEPSGTKVYFSTGEANYVPPPKSKISLITKIIDSGEGFYTINTFGKRLNLFDQLPAGYKILNNNVTCIDPINIGGRYLYDSGDFAKSCVFGLSIFNSDGSTPGVIPVTIQNTTARSLLGSQFTYSPPVYGSMPIGDTIDLPDVVKFNKGPIPPGAEKFKSVKYFTSPRLVVDPAFPGGARVRDFVEIIISIKPVSAAEFIAKQRAATLLRSSGIDINTQVTTVQNPKNSSITSYKSQNVGRLEQTGRYGSGREIVGYNKIVKTTKTTITNAVEVERVRLPEPPVAPPRPPPPPPPPPPPAVIEPPTPRPKIDIPETSNIKPAKWGVAKPIKPSGKLTVRFPAPKLPPKIPFPKGKIYGSAAIAIVMCVVQLITCVKAPPAQSDCTDAKAAKEY